MHCSHVTQLNAKPGNSTFVLYRAHIPTFMHRFYISRPLFVFSFFKVYKLDLNTTEKTETSATGVDSSKMANKGEFGNADVDISNLKSKTVSSMLFGTSFVCCPWKKFERPGVLNLLKWKMGQNDSNIPDKDELDKVLKVREVDDKKLFNPPDDKIQVTWIGHATVLVQFDGISVLSDPVFLDYCGPTRWTSYKRYRKAACEIKDIIKLDAVVISHDHYDHLETSAVQEIAERFPDVSWFVTLEQKKWLIKKGVNADKITELDWWDEKQITLNGKQFKFACVPSQHWCARTPPIDQCKCLWCGWVIKGPTKSYYFAGDTGYYQELFVAIGKKYGPFDLAAIPIGAYEPRYITEFQHVNPDEAVEIHLDVKSKQSIGMHWGTFELTNEFFVEPPQKVESIMMRDELDPRAFVSLSHGETWCVGDEREEPEFMAYKNKFRKEASGADDIDVVSRPTQEEFSDAQ